MVIRDLYRSYTQIDKIMIPIVLARKLKRVYRDIKTEDFILARMLLNQIRKI